MLRSALRLSFVLCLFIAGTMRAQEAPLLDVDAILARAGGACESPPTGEPLLIGYVPDFSEVGGFADIPGSQAAQFMVDLINCAGGLDGTPIELVIRPGDATDLGLTLRSAQDLVDLGVHAVLGPPFSDVGLPLLNVLGGQIPAIHVASTEVVLADPSIYSFIMTFTDEIQGSAAGEWAYRAGLRTAVTLSSRDNPYFVTTTSAFSKAFRALGGTVLRDYSYRIGDMDYSAQVNQIAALNPRPDVLYTANIMPFVEVLVGQLKAAGLSDIQIIGPDGFDTTRIIDGGETTDRAVYTTHAFPIEGSRLDIFLKAYEAAKGQPLSSFAVGPLGADAVLIISQAFLHSGKQFDPIAIGDAMTDMESFQLVTIESATYRGSDGSPLGSPVRDVILVRNIDGVPIFLEAFIPAEYP